MSAQRGLVLLYGSNSDARPWVERSSWQDMVKSRKLDVEASFWQDIAQHHDLGLLGCYYTNHKHEDMFIEVYTSSWRSLAGYMR